jgi:hypothetical protein
MNHLYRALLFGPIWPLSSTVMGVPVGYEQGLKQEMTHDGPTRSIRRTCCQMTYPEDQDHRAECSRTAKRSFRR